MLRRHREPILSLIIYYAKNNHTMEIDITHPPKISNEHVFVQLKITHLHFSILRSHQWLKVK